MKYFLPTKIIFGDWSFAKLFLELARAKIKKPLIVCGKHFLKSTKYSDIQNSIARFGLFHGVNANPTIADVDAIAQTLNSDKYDAIIGIGGGSVLDAAKVASVMKGSKKSCEAFYGKAKFSKKNKVPFFAIPTTSGSGSEVTKYAVLTLSSGVKKSLADNLLYTDVAIVDPLLTSTCPANVTASSGIDALCQGIEGYWAKTSTPQSRKFSAEAIKLAYMNLEAAVKCADRSSRHGMALASLRAGQGFSQTGTTGPHQVSYAWTRYHGLAHGFAVALTLPWFLEFYSQANMARCLEICELIGARTIEEGAKRITALLESIGAPTRLRDIGFEMDETEKVIEMSLAKRAQSPAQHTAADLRRLIGELY